MQEDESVLANDEQSELAATHERASYQRKNEVAHTLARYLPDLAGTEGTDIDTALHLPDLLAEGISVDADALLARLDWQQLAEATPALLRAGVKSKVLLRYLWLDEVVPHIDLLLQFGAEPADVVAALGRPWVDLGFDRLLTAGIAPELLAAYMTPRELAGRLPTLADAGADIDVLADRFSSEDLTRLLPDLLPVRGEIRLDERIERLDPITRLQNLDRFTDAGCAVDVARLVSELEPDAIYFSVGALLHAGGSTDQIIEKLKRWQMVGRLELLLEHGAEPMKFIERMDAADIARKIDVLLDAMVPASVLVRLMSSWGLAWRLDELLASGADPDEIARRLTPRHRQMHREALRAAGAKTLEDLAA